MDKIYKTNGISMKKIKEGKDIYYYNNSNELHREDGPAIECDDGRKYWYRNGLRHREDGPALEFSTGSKFWYKNGFLHREDGPAIEYADGVKEYWYNGFLCKEIKTNKELISFIKSIYN